MKTLRALSYIFIISVTCLSFTACGDDRTDVVDPSNVFTGKRLQGLNGMLLSYNNQELVTKIEYPCILKISFEYHDVTRAVNRERYVRMTVEDSRTVIPIITTYDMELGDNGFVKYCESSTSDGSTETWNFDYTSEGHLCYFKRSGNKTEVTNIEYEDGNVVKTHSKVDGEETVNSFSIYYTSEEIVNPIENVGCIMIFYIEFNVNLGYIEYAYYAGLLGRATKNLPVKKYIERYEREQNFVWSFFEDEYPKTFHMWGQDGFIYSSYDASFMW